jgi:hypothetical protein
MPDLSPSSETKISFFLKILYFLGWRFNLYFKIIKDYGWTLKQNNITIGSSYHGFETIMIPASIKKVPVSLRMHLTASDNKTKFTYLDTINVFLL